LANPPNQPLWPTSGHYQPPPNQGPPKRRHPFRTFLKVVFLLVVAFVGVSVVLGIILAPKTPVHPTTAGSPASTTAGSSTPTSLKPHGSVASAAKTSPWVLLANITGSGIRSTRQFTVGSVAREWAIAWAFNCGSQGSGIFNYFVEEGTQPNIHDFGPNQLGVSNSGAEYYYDTGTFNLEVDSACNWSIKASEVN
jgi:hypothetical protein